jgi:hypothetical protein
VSRCPDCGGEMTVWRIGNQMVGQCSFCIDVDGEDDDD